jgi:hypothetical protein
MNDKKRNIVLRAVSAAIKTNLVLLCTSLIVICAVVPGALMAQEPSTASAILSASAKLADELPRDVVRLALQAAIVSILALIVVIGAGYKLLAKMASKPCQMSKPEADAILRDKMYMAYKAGMDKAHQDARKE